MKKLLSILLALIMLLTLAACTGKSAVSAPADTTQQSLAMMFPQKTGDTRSAEEQASNEDAADAEKPVINWSWGTTLSDKTEPSVVAMQDMADELKEKTNGRFTLTLYIGASLGSESEMMDMLRTNTLTMLATNITNLPTYEDEFSIFALPYLFHSQADFLDYTNAKEGTKLTELYQKLEDDYNIRSLAVEVNGTRCLTTKGVKQITSPSDLKGVKIRSMEAQVWQDVITALGGTPIPVSFSELYMALQTGVVNGQDNPISVTYANKLYEVADYIYRTDHCYNTSMWLINPDAYDALDEEDRALFDSLVEKYIHGQYRDEMGAYTEKAVADIESSGCQIIDSSEFDIQAFYDNAAQLIDEKYMTNDAYAPFIQEIRERYHY